jgi:hypothetical protein
MRGKLWQASIGCDVVGSFLWHCLNPIDSGTGETFRQFTKKEVVVQGVI